MLVLAIGTTLYGMFCLAFTAIGANLVVIGVLGDQLRRPVSLSREAAWTLAELAYCLGNPIVYLLCLTNHSQLETRFHHSHAVLSFTWLVVVAFWATRLFGQVLSSKHPALARVSFAFVNTLAIPLGPFLFWTDLPELQKNWSNPWLFVQMTALYFIPTLLAVRRLTVLVRREPDAAILDLSKRFSGWMLLPAGALTAALAAAHPTPVHARSVVETHRRDIIAAAEGSGVPARLIAAIVFVNHAEQVSILRSSVENSIAAAWTFDPTSSIGLSDSFDASIGIAQIKPLTAQTALRVLAGGAMTKEYRGTPELDKSWKISREFLRLIKPSRSRELISRKALVTQLLDDAQNIQLEALILSLYAAHWESANPAWSIRHRPDILATLYSLGFEKSHPKPNPQPNEFGRHVAAAMQLDWMVEAFPE